MKLIFTSIQDSHGKVIAVDVEVWEPRIDVCHEFLEDHDGRWIQVMDGGEMIRFKSANLGEREYRRTGASRYPNAAEYEIVAET